MPYSKIKNFLIEHKVNMRDHLEKVGESEKFITMDQLIEGAVERLGSEDLVLNLLQKLLKRHKESLINRDVDEYPIDARDFIKDMGIHVAYKGVIESTWNKHSENYDYDKEFMKWWAKEKEISDQQMFCDHEEQDQFAEDGVWYNYTSVCRKCLLRMNESFDEDEGVDLVYKAWKRNN